jgi:hypothetical protein
MRIFITLLLSICLLDQSYAQLRKRDVVVLNELYTDPNKTTSEFLEFYNSSLKEVNLDDYTILIYFESGNTSGFYVMDLPSHNLARNGYYVLAPTSPFNAQVNVSVTPDLAWSNITRTDAYLMKFVRSGATYLPGTAVPAAEINNIIFKRSGSQGQFHVLIYDGTELVNFFVGGYSTIPTYVTSWPALTIPSWKSGSSITNKTISFSTLAANNVESVISNTGSDNGYHRTRDGQCGTWLKSNNGADHTPGSTNGAASNIGSLTTTSTLSQAGSNVNALNLAYRITATANANVWPVTVRVVNDYGTDDAASPTIFENKLPEAPTTPYNSMDEEEAVNTGSPDLSYTYPIPNVSAVMGAALSYKTSPVFTPNAYSAGYTGTRTSRAFHVFYQVASGCFDKVDYVLLTNAPVLPVNFKSFTAKRNKQQVHLNWQTANESNNAGFVVERNINGNWSEVSFVASKATGGNSEEAIEYQYIDLNSHKGITQYRIRQNDFNEKTTYSTVRSVQGEALGSKVVIYPNPSFDGRVQVVFADGASTRHVVISDMSGRIVRQLNGVINSSITVDGLNAGLYTARVIDQSTGESTLQKFVIQQK